MQRQLLSAAAEQGRRDDNAGQPLPRQGNAASAPNDSEAVVALKWAEMTLSQQFYEAEYGGAKYYGRNVEIAADKVSAELGDVAMNGFNVYTD